jgi:hypothetical protein
MFNILLLIFLSIVTLLLIGYFFIRTKSFANVYLIIMCVFIVIGSLILIIIPRDVFKSNMDYGYIPSSVATSKDLVSLFI